MIGAIGLIFILIGRMRPGISAKWSQNLEETTVYVWIFGLAGVSVLLKASF